jgi:hypothetical protein
MTPDLGRSFARVALFLGLLPAVAAAQEAVTVSGHVSAGGRPVQGATVRIQELNIGSTTDVEGRYSFIVPSSRVRGQTVTITARYVRFSPTSFSIVLVGGSLVKDFELLPIGEGRAANVSEAAPSNPIVVVAREPTLDSTVFDEVAGPIDLPAALAGRVVGLNVTTNATLGGSVPIVLRGYRSALGSNQPLFVIDGIPVENSAFLTPRQQFGSGGFDYGSAVQDLNPADVAFVRVLRGVEAAALFGGRAANGVILVSTKSGRALTGFEVSAAQQVSFESDIRLPELQNSYGQGLGGKFEFFNGAGGGVNDAIAENWGPALNGQPIAQASLTEPRRADVRPWVAHPDNVNGFFESGRTLKTQIAAQGSNGLQNFRLSADRRDTRGLTPASSLVRQGIGLTAGDQISAKLNLTARIQYGDQQGGGRPGTGFDTSNPIADFVVIGRQVDVAALKRRTKDTLNNQISWNYAGHNNPYFAALQNTNSDSRTRWLGGGSATYDVSATTHATVRTGIDRYDESRKFDVAKSWMAGFPYYAGRGDFSKGGFQDQTLTGSEINTDAFITARPKTSSGVFTVSGGVSHRQNSLHVSSVGSDQGPRSAATTQTTAAKLTADDNTNAVFASGELAVEDYASVSVSARNEWYSLLASGHNTGFYPALRGSIDLLRAGGRTSNSLSAARIRAGWSRSGGEISPLLLRNVFTGTQGTGTGNVTASSNLGPEITSTFELGGELGAFRGRLGLDLTYYNERTSDVVLGLPGASSTAFVATNAAAISNSGIEAQLTMLPLRVGANVDWTIQARYAKNTNRVEELSGSAAAVALGPTMNGITLQAAKGFALGALVGFGYRRDPGTQALLLENGHPLPEVKPRVLGTMSPDGSWAVNSNFHYGAFELSALVDARIGGSIFSLTNLLGATAGSLAETAFRPDTGLLITGVDIATGKANEQHVSTEAYYHSLAAIQERWVYDASVIKFRDLRLTVAFPLRELPVFSAQSLRVSLIGRNLAMWTKVPNIDPETALSTTSFQGIEMGQLPTTRSIGFQLSVAP